MDAAIEQDRLKEPIWKKWGPYVSNRQWATVREDYSDDGQAWTYVSYETARSKAYRWGEDGIGGVCDDDQVVCFAVALWNKKDPFIKERLFGLTNYQGNHGEDVKEMYYYLDSTPSHSYMKMLYKYPMDEFPYKRLVQENKKRTRLDPEFEIIDTGVFDNGRYFDVFTEYAKNDAEDILIRISVFNRSSEPAALNILPTIWFRNTWSWGENNYKPVLRARGGDISLFHEDLGGLVLHVKDKHPLLFCDNETNFNLLQRKRRKGFYKDGINEYIVNHDERAINKKFLGTKAAINADVLIDAGGSHVVELRLSRNTLARPFQDFNRIMSERQQQADAFYGALQQNIHDEDARLIQRQALAGMLWNKQYYYYDVDVWLNGDPNLPVSPRRQTGRNHQWMHLHNADVISMPDKWEYPWYAAWDLAFHCIPLSMVDVDFAKQQLLLLTQERYMHPNGQLPAYEWDFSDVNPPVHAWAVWEVYSLERSKKGEFGDLVFLETIFHKLLMNFTWWVNRKDKAGNNVFQGGFLGLDNIGVFDRNSSFAYGAYIEQADGTSWMAMYCLNMLRISLELSRKNAVYQHMATKFFEHFLYIAGAMAHMGEGKRGLWDDQDGFFYDQLRYSREDSIQLKVRSMVGLIPLFAVEVLDDAVLTGQPEFREKMQWFMNNRPDLAGLVSRWQETNENAKHLLSLLRPAEILRLLQRMLDETEFLSAYGIRSLSKVYEHQPYEVDIDNVHYRIEYTPGESTNAMFGGNSNWRGPIWIPLNYMIIESLEKFQYYYNDSLKIECPAGSENFMTLQEVAREIIRRLKNLYLRNSEGNRVAFGDNQLLQHDPNFRDYLMFFEFFHGDTGKGLGACQQTGWTGLIAELFSR